MLCGEGDGTRRGEAFTVVPAQRVPVQGTTETLNLQVRPIRPGNSAQGFFLILFEKKVDPLTAEEQAAERETISREVGDELQSLKEQLNATVEQFEASSEELKAQNEELQAMNEELRSAAEELETSKEELQSVNEELTTVNQELKEKVEELSGANSDLNNLMTSTDLATIFLDRQLRVVRFTPRVQETFNLLPADMGRPISDITHKLRYETLMADAEGVLERLSVIEREAETEDGRTFLARMSPYRTLDDRISGVVVTLIDVTRVKAVEAELRESEQRLQRMVNVARVGVLTLDYAGTFLDANDAFIEMLGYSREEWQKNTFTWRDFTPEEHTAATIKIMQQFRETGRGGPYEKEYFRKDGSRIWIMFVGANLGDGTIVEYAIDISDRKRAEEAERASEERVRTIADNVPQLIWTNDAEGTADYFNKRWFDYSGLNYEESYGRGWEAVVHPEDAPASIEHWKLALAKGEVFDAEYRLRGADGEYRWFIGRNVPLRSNGTVLSWFGTATDIHGLKEAEAALRESEERFRLLVEGAPDYAMFLLDPANVITFWSVGAERVFGWRAEEALGQSGELIFTPEDRARDQEEKEIKTALRKGVANDRRWHLRKDGSRVWMDGVMRRLDDENGNLRGFAKIARDATELHQAEQELKTSHQDLERRVLERTAQLTALNEKLKTEIKERAQVEQELLLVSEREKRRIGQDLHDSLCQELAASALFLRTASHKMEKKSPAGAKVLEDAARIVNDNVGLARDLARGLHPVELSSQGLANALRELTFRTSQVRSVTCQFECPRQVRIRDEAVALNLYRIAQEAVTNAVKNGNANAIVIKLVRNGKELVLSVKDNGKGFSVAKSPSGMGLHIMKYRADVIGARLTIESADGHGALVTCILPRE